MSDDQPNVGARRRWPVILSITLIVAIYAMTQYALKRDPSQLPARVDVCTAGYQQARTAIDTAAVDAQTPPSRSYLRPGQERRCEYFRNEGATK